MANHASALKRHRQSEKRRLRNASMGSSIKTAMKHVVDAVKGGKQDEARKKLVEAVTLLDKGVSKGVLHRNNASRKISRLALAVNSISGK